MSDSVATVKGSGDRALRVPCKEEETAVGGWWSDVGGRGGAHNDGIGQRAGKS